MIFYLTLAYLSYMNVVGSIGPGLSKLSYQSGSSMTVLNPGSQGQSTDAVNTYAYWNCHTIPPNMTLCKSVGYSRMVLPNFLKHESLREAIQQANVWVALVNTDCHPDIQRFLCALYAPVCLKSHQEAKIPPCWELCTDVRNACLPRMRLFGFDWPEIVRCEQFPRLAESMCIPSEQKNTAVTCVPCEQAITLENIASSYCMSDAVLKASIKDLIPEPNQASVILKLSPRTMAFKLIRNDGTQLNSIDQYRKKRQSRDKQQQQQQPKWMNRRRFYRNANYPLAFATYNQNRHSKPFQDYYHHDAPARRRTNRREGGKRRNRMKRRKARNSKLHDLDGITELVLSCSACGALLPFTSGRLAPGLVNQRWLIMGRRIRDAKTNKFSHQLQVTFLSMWNRESVEFRQSLYAIRKEPVSHLCNKNQASLASSRTPSPSVASNMSRPLKILRSAPSDSIDRSKQAVQLNLAQLTNTLTPTQLSHRSLFAHSNLKINALTKNRPVVSNASWNLDRSHPPYANAMTPQVKYKPVIDNYYYDNKNENQFHAPSNYYDSQLKRQHIKRERRRRQRKMHLQQSNRGYLTNKPIQTAYRAPINPYAL